MRRWAWVGVLLAGWSANGQAPARPEFEVANIKPNKSNQPGMEFNMLPSGQFVARNVKMRDIFNEAYGVRRETTAGNPDWFDKDTFDIVGKAPAGTPDDALGPMLQSLVIDEFKLATHTEDRPVNVFALVVGKNGPKLQASEANGKGECKRAGAQGPDAGGSHVACTNVTMRILAEVLPDLAPAYVNKLVVDQTGLTGTYDLRLDWVGARNLDAVGGVSMFGAVEKLGLKLDEKKLTVPVVVIDHIEKLADQ